MSESKTKPFKISESVQWKWLGRVITGKVKEVHTVSVTKTIKTKKIKRNGSTDNPAYLVESEAGNLALKLHSELKPVEKKKSGKVRPKMFSWKCVPLQTLRKKIKNLGSPFVAF